jgi:hypothetical protein
MSTSATIRTDGVRGAAPPQLYQTCRHLDPTFVFPGSSVPDGRYEVRLHMAEPHFTDCSQARRRISIRIENVLVERDLDPCVAAGGCRRAVVREYDVRVAEGEGLTVAFDGQGRDGFVMGIEVVERDGR